MRRIVLRKAETPAKSHQRIGRKILMWLDFVFGGLNEWAVEAAYYEEVEQWQIGDRSVWNALFRLVFTSLSRQYY
jgi:hypothetical protein